MSSPESSKLLELHPSFFSSVQSFFLSCAGSESIGKAGGNNCLADQEQGGMGVTSSRGGEYAMAAQSPALLQGRRAGPEVEARLSQGCRPSGK